jgi:hypothetical protein
MVDAQFTWRVQGKAFLCRIVDMFHMGTSMRFFLVTRLLSNAENCARVGEIGAIPGKATAAHRRVV